MARPLSAVAAYRAAMAGVTYEPLSMQCDLSQGLYQDGGGNLKPSLAWCIYSDLHMRGALDADASRYKTFC